MTSFSGKYVKSFSEANSAIATDVHMNGDYHFFFDIVQTEPNKVVLKSLKDGSTFEKRIVRRNGLEWISYEHSGVFQRMFKAKPEKIKVVPFKRDNV